jgi:hypothetical protein
MSLPIRFFAGEPACVVTNCNRHFSRVKTRLSGLIWHDAVISRAVHEVVIVALHTFYGWNSQQNETFVCHVTLLEQGATPCCPISERENSSSFGGKRPGMLKAVYCVVRLPVV